MREALFLFIILLLGLVVSFLGENYFNKEGFDSSNDNNNNNNNNNRNNNRKYNFDNYNHYNGVSSDSQLQNSTVFTDSSGNQITVLTNSDGTQSLKLILNNNNVPILLISSPSSIDTYHSQNNNWSATIIHGETIKITNPDGKSILFTQPMSSTQYFGSTGTPIQPNVAYVGQNGYAGQNEYAGQNGYVGQNGYYVQGQNGNTIMGTTNKSIYNSSGIPASQIQPGKEDLYILKSEIVPPVCPACPASSTYARQEPCPACPACARCPEASFECKKVPNYNAINNDALPQPLLSDFSSFGM
jgi:hypothetical protein